METQETTQENITKPAKVYKTPDYIRKSVNRYIIKQKLNNNEEFKQKQREISKRYYDNHKKKTTVNNTIDILISNISNIEINAN